VKAGTDNVLVTQELTKQYGSVKAVRCLCIVAAPGEVIGLLGDNGAGKSSLLKVQLVCVVCIFITRERSYFINNPGGNTVVDYT
jgi:ABC-type lipopolysaccharide export system ATPase subunit